MMITKEMRLKGEEFSICEAIVIPSQIIDWVPKSQSISDRQQSRFCIKVSQNEFSSKLARSICSCRQRRRLIHSTTSLILGIISLSQVIILALTLTKAIGLVESREVVAAQDVDLNFPLETPLGISGDDNDQVAPQTRLGRSKAKNLDEFLENLPILSVGQKHQAKFDCELSSELETFRLIWLRLSRTSDRDRNVQDGNSTARGNSDDIMLISLNQKIITPDKRFKVHQLSALRWILSVDNVNANDGEAYYLCQVSSTSSTDNSTASAGVKLENLGSWFVGGARLNVLVPPRIVESETSPSLVQANEYEELVLRCKVTSEPQAQLMWKREDGQSLDEMDVEQKFRHETKRGKATIETTLKPYSHIISIDSSELIFRPFRRHQAAPYLCIASNGVQPGVSQRVNVLAVNCRTNSVRSANEPCESESSSARTRTAYPDDVSSDDLNTKGLSATTATTTTTTTTVPTSTAFVGGRRKVWSSKSSNQSTANSKLDLQRRLLADQRADKRKTGSLATNRNRNDLLAGQVSIKNSNNNGNNDSHSRWQQEASNRANCSFKDSQTTGSRALISLMFAFLVVVIQFLSL